MFFIQKLFDFWFSKKINPIQNFENSKFPEIHKNPNFSILTHFDKKSRFFQISTKSEKNPKIQKFRNFPIFPIFTKSPFFPIFPKSEKTQKASRVKDFRFLSFFCKSRHSESNWSPLPLHPYPQESIDYCICQNFSEMAEKWESVTWEPT